MAYFKVVLEATGIDVPSLEGGTPLVGFFAIRLVRASSSAEAGTIAKEMVWADWTTGTSAPSNCGGRPVLKVDAVYLARWWERFTFKNKGHSFFTTSDNDSDQAARSPTDRATTRGGGA